MQENNEECIPGEYYMQDGSEMTKKVCPFRRTSLSLCSGLSDTDFGYQEGKPCVLLKMNRVTLAISHRSRETRVLFLFSAQPLFSTYLFPKINDAAMHSFNLSSCFSPFVDYWPEANWGSLHQLHGQSKAFSLHYTCPAGLYVYFLSFLFLSYKNITVSLFSFC